MGDSPSKRNNKNCLGKAQHGLFRMRNQDNDEKTVEAQGSLRNNRKEVSVFDKEDDDLSYRSQDTVSQSSEIQE